MPSAGTRLQWARKAAGYKTAKAFAEAHGLPVSTYSTHEKGSRALHRRAERYATLLGNCTPGWLLTGEGAGPPDNGQGAAPASLRFTTVVGAVQAGEWLEAFEWPAEDQYQVSIPDNNYDPMDLFALEVRGASMNQVYPEGSIVVCVRPTALGREPKDGERVVSQRTDPNGMIEANVKTIRTDAGGLRWLWPESDDPNHQAPINLAGEEIIITGVVIYSIKSELL